MAIDTDELDREKRQAGLVSMLWIGGVAAIFGWQAIYYRGLIERAAEWQYRVIGHYYPGLTFLALCLVFSLPLLAVLLILRRRWRGKGLEGQDPGAAAVDASRRLQLLWMLVAILIGGSAAASLLYGALLPGDGGAPYVVDVAKGGTARVHEGAAIVRGVVDLDAVSRFEERALLVHRRLNIAPVRMGEQDNTPARFFVEVRETPHLATPFVAVTRGVLRRNSLPGEVRRLYQSIRYPVDRTTWLLYRDAGRLRWRPYMVAAQLAVVALAFALAAWLEGRRKRRLMQRLGTAVSV